MSEATKLATEITELCSYIYAAEARLLALIREFDEPEAERDPVAARRADALAEIACRRAHGLADGGIGTVLIR